MQIKFLIILFVALISACRENVPPTNNQMAKPVISATVAPSVTPDKSKIKNFDGTGIITKINLEIGSVELDHEEIKGLMPKMIMEFYVSDVKMLERLKVGDKVDFVLEDNAGVEQIINIKKGK